jgi:hypothetical protein
MLIALASSSLLADTKCGFAIEHMIFTSETTIGIVF